MANGKRWTKAITGGNRVSPQRGTISTALEPAELMALLVAALESPRQLPSVKNRGARSMRAVEVELNEDRTSAKVRVTQGEAILDDGALAEGLSVAVIVTVSVDDHGRSRVSLTSISGHQTEMTVEEMRVFRSLHGVMVDAVHARDPRMELESSRWPER